MERLFVIPGINRAVGLDVILDLVPFAGSTAGALLGAYMAWEARNLGMSKTAMARMAGNVGVDWVLGLIPWVGADPRFLLPLEHAQPSDRQAPPRPASSRRRDDRRQGHPPPTPEKSALVL